MPYLNVDEVESALAVAAAAPNAAFTQLVTLPNQTWEGRTCHAARLASGGGANRPGVFLLGGVHSREWGSSDILIFLLEQLQQSYRTSSALTLGGKTFAAGDVARIVDGLDLLLFPQANPDGRQFSQVQDAMWRKNRRPMPAGHSNPNCVGVDVNRNYDFLWSYPEYFSPSAPIQNSTSPCDHDVYIGPSAFSEPETQNVRWLFDENPGIRFFVDLHSYGPLIMYSWGDAPDQSGDPRMNFQNPTYNGKRGLNGAQDYHEYIPSGDQATAEQLAQAMRSAVAAVRGNTSYEIEQSFGLYPTAGASDDYAYSRHFVDSTRGLIYSYTLEWGTEFQPPYAEMEQIIQEVSAGLVGFCLAALAVG
jgi:carboxypeptidase T